MRRSGQVAETALGHGVLVGEQPVIRFEFQLPGSGTGVADYGRTEAARIPGRHGGRKENPGMGARAGAGNFQGDRHAKLAAGSGKSLGIVAPVGLVKIDGEEMASVAGEQRIDTDDMVAGKVVVNDVISERQQQAVSAFAAFHPLLVAEADLPFVAAGRGVARLAAVLFLPAYRVDIGTATEQPPE